KVYFTLQQDVPVITQELLLAYWRKNGRPERIALLPLGEVRIRKRGTDKFGSEILNRYTLHGVTWGNETAWLNSADQIAVVIGTDAEEDRVEIIRPSYQHVLKQLADRAAADAVEDLEA